jgi:hypothetical protein
LNSALTPVHESERDAALAERGHSAPTVALSREGGENGNGSHGTVPGAPAS